MHKRFMNCNNLEEFVSYVFFVFLAMLKNIPIQLFNVVDDDTTKLISRKTNYSRWLSFNSFNEGYTSILNSISSTFSSKEFKKQLYFANIFYLFLFFLLIIVSLRIAINAFFRNISKNDFGSVYMFFFYHSKFGIVKQNIASCVDFLRFVSKRS